MYIKDVYKILTSFIIINSITILLSFPSTALAENDDAQLLADLLSQPTNEFDISYLGWDVDHARDTVEELISGPLHYSSMELADIITCTLWSEGDTAVKITTNRLTNQQNLDILHKKLNTRIKGIGVLTSHIADEEERAWILLRILAETVTYDKDKPGSHSPYGALLRQEADCAGISTAYKLLCDASGIDCDVVSGVVYEEDNMAYGHAWNVLHINGEERYVNVTFSLTDTGQASKEWFLLSKDLMWWKKHYLDGEEPLEDNESSSTIV